MPRKHDAAPETPMHASTTEILWIYSMGKRFRVRAITTSDEQSNTFMNSHTDTAIIACYGPFQLIANLYAGERDHQL
jgi:hypothetical protein